MAFPEKFTWGAAAAAYQGEGAARDDGRGESVWDLFCRRDGAVLRGESGDLSGDHYHRFREDVAIMKQIGTSSMHPR